MKGKKGASLLSPVRAKPKTQKIWDGVVGGKYTLISTTPEWVHFYNQLKTKTHVACDTETTGLSYLTSHIVGLSFSWGSEHSFYIPIRHTRLVPLEVPGVEWNPKKPTWKEMPTEEKQVDDDLVISNLREFFSNPDLVSIWHNAKFDLHFLHREHIEVKGLVHDTMLMSNLLDENSKHSLKYLASALIHKEADKWEKLVDEFRGKFGRSHKIPKKNVHYGFLPFDLAVPYAASDAHYTWLIFKKFISSIGADKALRDLYIQIESKLMWVLLDMERKGACIDVEFLKQESPKMGAEMEALEKKIKAELGSNININSVQQLVPALQKKGVHFTKKSKKTQKPSLDREVLVKLAPKYPICDQLLKYRDLKKQKSTYVDSLAEKAELDDKVHCTFKQNVSTGRLASFAPSLMNIPGNSDTTRSSFVLPIRHICSNCGWEDDRVIIVNECPVCERKSHLDLYDDYFMLFIDFSQIELRLCAHYSQDPIMLEVYNKTKEDIHTRTMCELFQKYSYRDAVAILNDPLHSKYKEVKRERKVAKTTNFLIIYGGGAANLAAKVSSPDHIYTERECRGFIRSYFQRFRGIQRWKERAEKQLKEDLKIQNHFGRYRRLPELKNWQLKTMSSNWQSRWEIARAVRQGINHLIQSSAADLFKISMIRVHKLLEDTMSRLVMPIHDEVVIYMRKPEIKLLPTIIHEMENFDFRVPIIADVSFSQTNWNEKQELILT